MDIYLDIDSIILGAASPREDIELWPNYILNHFKIIERTASIETTLMPRFTFLP